MRAWRLDIDDVRETPSSILAFGRRDAEPIVLKIIRTPGDEWWCGKVLQAMQGDAVVRVLEHEGGAVLMERLSPATSLAERALTGDDDGATEIIADVIGRMVHAAVTGGVPTAADWGRGFAWYHESGDRAIDSGLVRDAEALYAHLCATQRATRLLHGDLQHYNVLLDSQRGWVCIDPKGVMGELEYELGAMLRNPVERPALFADADAVERRLGILERTLEIDRDRARQWCFALAVLSAIWGVEDGSTPEDLEAPLRLARALQP